jgi:hypothetical protein
MQIITASRTPKKSRDPELALSKKALKIPANTWFLLLKMTFFRRKFLESRMKFSRPNPKKSLQVPRSVKSAKKSPKTLHFHSKINLLKFPAIFSISSKFKEPINFPFNLQMIAWIVGSTDR